MKLEADETFRAEVARYGLVRSCEDCALYDEAKDRCAHGYPTAEHKKSADARLVVFCKDFEAA
jgi:hypothetical protein